VVALPANVTTPMKWRIEPEPDAAVLALADRRYADQPPADCAGCTGYGGTDSFTFETKGAGAATLHFRYLPLRGEGPAQREVSIEVRVAAP
jgi:hypothetical protein